MSEPPRVPRSGAAALALRLAGASYGEVAEALGLPSAEAARDHAETALAARAWGDTEGREKLRAENAARIERLLRGLWQKATDPDHPEHLPAAKVALALVDRVIRLYGLDAPTEFVVHNPTAQEIDAWVAGVVQGSTSDLRAMEADIIDAHVVDELIA